MNFIDIFLKIASAKLLHMVIDLFLWFVNKYSAWLQSIAIFYLKQTSMQAELNKLEYSNIIESIELQQAFALFL